MSDSPVTLQPGVLAMPRVGEPFGVVDDPPVRVPLAGRVVRGYDVLGTRCADERRLFRFRWILGHQMCFLLWRVLGDVTHRGSGEKPDPRSLELMAACVDGYSSAMLYASTVPRAHYQIHLRVSMALQHPSFSGAWAADYRPIRWIFRNRAPWQADGSCPALARAIARNHVVHDRVADHLVPQGHSLLQESAGHPGTAAPGEKEDLYDNYFLVIRRPVNRPAFLTQFDSRVEALSADLAAHGFFPEIEGRHHPIPESETGPTKDLVADALRPLLRARRLMAEERFAEDQIPEDTRR